jgi:hypothetical protein
MKPGCNYLYDFKLIVLYHSVFTNSMGTCSDISVDDMGENMLTLTGLDHLHLGHQALRKGGIDLDKLLFIGSENSTNFLHYAPFWRLHSCIVFNLRKYVEENVRVMSYIGTVKGYFL